jgi:hypothetical protein
MEIPPRHYMVLAFLPVILAAVTLIALYFYQRGAEERRDRWQKPEAILDALGVGPGMRVAEWRPTDTYFLERLADRVGSGGEVFAVQTPPRLAEAIGTKLREIEVVGEPPLGLDAVLLVHLTMAEQDLALVEHELEVSSEKLKQGGRVGWIGVRSEQVDGFIEPDDAAQLATDQGLQLLGDERFVERQFLLVLEKN